MPSFDFNVSLNSHINAFLKLGNEVFLNQVKQIGKEICETINSGHKILTFGNGGSAAEASHFVTELVSKCSTPHEPWPAISLSDSNSNLTAIGNDYGFEHVFSRQLIGIASPGDCVIAFSTSGSSPNVLKALAAATQIGCVTYLFTGLNYVHDVNQGWQPLIVPSTETTVIQEIHLWLIHALSEFCEANI